MDMGLKGRVAVVTGGARGLGRAICESFAREGCHVAVNCRRGEQRGHPVEEAEAFVDGLRREYGVESVLAVGDVSDARDVEGMFDATEEAIGKADIVVNNAAVWPTCLVKDMSEEQWDRTLAVNLKGAFLVCREAVRRWTRDGTKGSIVNVASQAAFLGSTTGHADYAAAKAGLVNFTMSLARENALAGINVNAVAPGMMTTDMTEEIFKCKARMDDYLERIPMERIASPREVADVVVFVASERARYMTGATVNVSGGMLMR